MRSNQSLFTPVDPTFGKVRLCKDVQSIDADVAIVGTHYHSPYPFSGEKLARLPGGVSAAETIRRQSIVYAGHWERFNFDFNALHHAGRDIRIVDCGDIGDAENTRENTGDEITKGIEMVREQGAVPIVMGTDEGATIFVMRAFKDARNLCVVHIDAHIDWRDERDGVRDGGSSVMRRASEMSWIGSMAQVGLRGIGSARQEEVDAALEYGSVFIRARDIHKEGIEYSLDRIPEADEYYFTIDSDALDLAMAPGVLYPTPDGLTYDEITDLFFGLAKMGKIAGVGLFEVRPSHDVNNLTSSTASHLLVNFIGALAQTGRIGY